MALDSDCSRAGVAPHWKTIYFAVGFSRLQVCNKEQSLTMASIPYRRVTLTMIGGVLLGAFIDLSVAQAAVDSRVYCLSDLSEAQARDLVYGPGCLSKPQDCHADSFGLDRRGTDRFGWEWTGPRFDGHVFHSGFLQDPDDPSNTFMPELYAEPCWLLSRVLGSCKPAFSDFSPATGTAFIEGYEGGANTYRSYAVAGGRASSLPTLADSGTTFTADIEYLGVAVLRGPDHEVFVFDGETIKPLHIPTIASDSNIDFWYMFSNEAAKRTFLFSAKRRREHALAFEVHSDFSVSQVFVDQLPGSPKPASLIDDSGIFLFINNKIYLITSGPHMKLLFEDVRHPADRVVVRAANKDGILLNYSSHDDRRFRLLQSREQVCGPNEIELIGP